MHVISVLYTRSAQYLWSFEDSLGYNVQVKIVMGAMYSQTNITSRAPSPLHMKNQENLSPVAFTRHLHISFFVHDFTYVQSGDTQLLINYLVIIIFHILWSLFSMYDLWHKLQNLFHSSLTKKQTNSWPSWIFAFVSITPMLKQWHVQLQTKTTASYNCKCSCTLDPRSQTENDLQTWCLTLKQAHLYKTMSISYITSWHTEPVLVIVTLSMDPWSKDQLVCKLGSYTRRYHQRIAANKTSVGNSLLRLLTKCNCFQLQFSW